LKAEAKHAGNWSVSACSLRLRPPGL